MTDEEFTFDVGVMTEYLANELAQSRVEVAQYKAIIQKLQEERGESKSV